MRALRTPVIAALATLLMAGAVHAADLAKPAPKPAEEPAAAMHSPWSSCYIEAGASRVIGLNEADLGLGSLVGTTVSLGGGCDRDLGSKVIVGGFGSYGLGIGSTKWFDGAIEARIKSPWMLAARAGYLLTSSTLAYGVIGYSSIDLSVNGVSTKLDGLVLGAGTETLMGKWSFGLEYLWHDLGERDAHGHEVGLRVKHRF